MAAVIDYKEIKDIFSNSKEKTEIEYDFDNDAGAIGALDLIKFEFAAVVTRFYVKGVTELDSAADGTTVDCGIKAGDTNALLDGIAEAVFAVGAVVYDAAAQVLPLKVPADGILQMELIGEALTSGKCKFVVEYEKF